jgi:hypothetical protein
VGEGGGEGAGGHVAALNRVGRAFNATGGCGVRLAIVG